ncbi:MAG: hypothetical protein OIF50_17820 [Flavobacteriaceae bacterium]|nr:hypothetical protein [Flavobacteriaceae bacterium]
MEIIFNAVYHILKKISQWSGFTYHEVNIILYYILLPLFYMYLIARIRKQNWWLYGYLIWIVFLLLVIPDFEIFSSWLFQKSEAFLRAFSAIGWDYTLTSVLICVCFPFGLLLWLWFFIKK